MAGRDDTGMPPPPIPSGRTTRPSNLSTTRTSAAHSGPTPSRAMPQTSAPFPTGRTTMPPPTTTTPRPGAGPSTTMRPPPVPRGEPPAQPDAVVLPSNPAPPAQVLTTETAVATWPSTPGYKGFIDWLRRRCERIRGKPIVEGDKAYEGAGEAATALMRLLDAMIAWVDEVPPLPQENQRFGNRAFRDYIALVEKRLPDHLPFDKMPPHLKEQILPLFIDSHAFGHPTRLDYGTGHELAFVLALWCCVVSGWAGDEDAQDMLILRVFPRYLDLTTKLQATYRLEPAGSHGVWGLDDYCFLPYLFGSAQLLGSDITPGDALKAATTTDGPFTDLYTLSLHRVGLFKRGAAFSEHSPLLDSLAQFPSWVKPHGGLLKMFQAEVLGKRVVVQGLYIGGWCWGNNLPDAYAPEPDPVADGGAATAAPWKVKQLADANASWGAGA